MVDITASLQPLAGLSVAVPAGEITAGGPVENVRLRAEAERFEAAFLAEMLRHSGLGRMPETFNGGPGEAAFAGTLVQEYATRIAATGRLGIAERIYDSLAGHGLE
ncbi:MAG: rod-binding protein [Paracoccaceae bacterium]